MLCRCCSATRAEHTAAILYPELRGTLQNVQQMQKVLPFATTGLWAEGSFESKGPSDLSVPVSAVHIERKRHAKPKVDAAVSPVHTMLHHKYVPSEKYDSKRGVVVHHLPEAQPTDGPRSARRSQQPVPKPHWVDSAGASLPARPPKARPAAGAGAGAGVIGSGR